MTLEIGGFLALAALMIGLVAWLRADMKRSEERLGKEIAGLREEMAGLRADMQRGDERLGEEMTGLGERMARMEGMFEILARSMGLPRPAAAE